MGSSGALLLGNLCAAWASELINSAPQGAPALAVRALFDELCTELIAGEYQDVGGFQDYAVDVEHALNVVRHKTTRYSVERPLQIGAVLGGAGPVLLDACTAYARPVGEAFQMWDDLDDVTVGSSSEGIRTGKRTVVLILARRMPAPAPAKRLRTLMGNPDLEAGELEEARPCRGVRCTGRRPPDDRRTPRRGSGRARPCAVPPFGPPTPATHD